MYYHFYAVNENPFALTPDPKYLLLSESHREALASMTYGVQERKGFILILGEVGTGKTTLIRHILGQFGPDIKTAYILNTVEHFTDLLYMMLHDLGMQCPHRDRLEMMQALNAYLLQQATAGRYVVLIIDEAQHLPEHVLEELRMLSNLETTRNKLLQIILVGQPELAGKLARPSLRQLRQRIALVAQVKPLTRAETALYIMHRLHVAGYTGQRVFTSRAVRRIQRASGGIPRLINVICDRALVMGYGMDAMPITSRMVKAVIQEDAVFKSRHVTATRPRMTSALSAPQEHSPWNRRRLVVAVLVLLVTGGLLLGIAQQPKTGFWQYLNAKLKHTATASQQVVQRFWNGSGGRDTGSPSVPEQASVFAADAPSPVVATATSTSAVEQSAVATPSVVGTAVANAKPHLPEQARVSQESPSDSPTPSLPAPVTGQEVMVQPGDSLTTLIRRVYGQVHLTLFDLVRMTNPVIDNINIINVGSRLHFPPLHPATWVHKEAEAFYTVHLLTTTNQAEIDRVQTSVGALGHRVYVIPVYPSYNPEVVWYRVMVGDFADSEQAATFSHRFTMPERSGWYARSHTQNTWQRESPLTPVP